jgi:hypothetical protein
MGSLILVLLVMDRKAHRAAQARAQREAARLVEETARNESARETERKRLHEQARKEWEQKREALHEKLTHEQIELQLQMRKVREELQGIAARLHYEQDTSTQLRHKVKDERSRLQAEEQLLKTLRSNSKQSEGQSKESSQSLRRMTLDLLQMEQVLKDLKASRQRERKTFSVVPYHGRRGEDRRPLYVECTADSVIFHPERKVMAIAALIPGYSDPSSEVRAEVERRIAQQSQKLAALPNNVDKTPYLLLLLRPSGVRTYHMLQATLKGLPLDFGYEFIDEDWVLDFPADDELPSTQPWMMATKTPARPADVPPTPASAPPRTSARPLAGAPMGNPVGAFSSGIRGFRATESGGIGNWARGGANPSDSPTSGKGGSTGGTGSAAQGGSVVSGFSGPQSPGGNPIRGTLPGASPPLTNGAAKPFMTSIGSPAQLGNGEPGGVGTVSNSGGIGTGVGRGNGRGHPSAMPPAFPSEEGGTIFSNDVGASGGGSRGIGGMYRSGSGNGGSGSGTGLPMDGSQGSPGSEVAGLGPPRALSSGQGEGYAGGGTGQTGIAGIGSTGNGVPGNSWRNGLAGAGTSGSLPGMGVSSDGSYVIARGNNGDAPVQSFNNSGGVVGGGSTTMSGSIGNGGSGPGTTNNYGPNSGLPGPGGPYSGTQTRIGGSSTGQANGGMLMPGALGNGSSSGVPNNNGPYPNAQGSGSNSSGTGQALYGGGGVPGAVGSGAPGAPGNGGSLAGTQSSGAQATLGSQGNASLQGSNGPNPNAQGSGANSSGTGQPVYNGGGVGGAVGTATPGASGNGGSPAGTQLSGSQAPLGSQGNVSPQGVAGPSQGTGGSAAGTVNAIGGTATGQAAAGAPMPTNGGRSSDVVIFVDPLTGQPTTAPRPPPPPEDGSAETPPEDANGNRRTPRIRVVPVNNASSGGGYVSGENESPAMNRLAPPPSFVPQPRRLSAPRPAWLHGGRDWTIYVECRAGAVVLYPSQQTFTLAQVVTAPAGNPLIKTIQQMIDRRQSSRRAGEPPYHPQVCLLVRPEHIRTFLTVYPALEALPVPKTRRNLDADDDVIGIVTGAVP